MPKGDRQILKADPEDGTTPIANLLLEALAIAKLTGKEKGAVLYLWRVTYGWAVNGERLKEREITLTTWSKILQTDEGKASKILTGIVNKNILLRTYLGPGKSYSYSMNTRVAEWDKGCLNRQGLSEIARQGLSEKTRVALPKKATPTDTNLAMPKESIKERLKKDIYIVLFNLWNELRIISHKKLTSDMKRAIDSAQQDYSQEEIEQSIKNYAVIVKGSEYYFNHKWTLVEFLSRRRSNNIERFLDLEVAKANFKKEVGFGARQGYSTKLPTEYTRPEDS